MKGHLMYINEYEMRMDTGHIEALGRRFKVMLFRRTAIDRTTVGNECKQCSCKKVVEVHAWGAGTMLMRTQRHNERVDSTGKSKANTGGFYRLQQCESVLHTRIGFSLMNLIKIEIDDRFGVA
ncbi:hypothetical protein JHK85_050735 [Glycine max]|nr:hypothetical protein JHK85_050735 [Glycine max]